MTAVSPDASVAVHGARWITVSSLVVGALNYAYALLLMHILSAEAYTVFAAGQGLVLGVATVAVVSIPWVLAQGVARARNDGEKAEAVRFATVVGIVSGLVATALVTGLAAQFASLASTVVLAAGTLLVFVTTVTVGWLQGTERMRTLACVTAGEAVLKFAVGLALVMVLHLSDTGALTALAAGALPFLIWWPRRVAPGTRRRLFDAAVDRRLWRRAAGIASVQGLVALLTTADVVLITILPTDPTAAASYQASAMVGRIPLFLGSAIAMAFLPALARRRSGTSLATSAVQMYLTMALPFTAICVTAPGVVIHSVFPSEYAHVTTLLVFCSLSGLAVGALTLAATFCQAVDDYECLRVQCLGVAVYAVAVVIGWETGGVVGLAMGTTAGTIVATILLVVRVVRRGGVPSLFNRSLLISALSAGVLLAVRPLPALWLVAAMAVVARATVLFYRHHAPTTPGAAAEVVDGPPAHGATDRTSVANGQPRGTAEQMVSSRISSTSGGERPGRTRVVVSAYDNLYEGQYGGGGAAVIARVAEKLADDFDVTVVTAGPRGTTQTHGSVHYRHLPVSWAGPRAGQLLFQAMLPFAARTTPHDLWLESFTPPFSTSFLPLFTRSPVIGIDQGRSGEAMWRKYRIPFFVVERWGFRCYRNLVVMNEADAVTVQELSRRSSVHVIPNGVDARPVDETRLGNGSQILFLGRIDTQQKGLDLLLAAYAKSERSLPLVIAGEGTKSEERRLAGLLDRFGSHVVRAGRVGGHRKEQLLRDSAFVVLPSRNETFGLSALEGMSYGKPVIHFDLPSLRWMRAGGAVCLPLSDTDALGQAMDRLAADTRWRGHLGAEALSTSQHFTWERMEESYAALAHNVLGHRVPARDIPLRRDGADPWPPTH